MVGIDHIKDLVNLSVTNTARAHDELMSSDRLQYVVGDGRKGYPPGAPYDCIHVGAAAPTLPQPVSAFNIVFNQDYLRVFPEKFENVCLIYFWFKLSNYYTALTVLQIHFCHFFFNFPLIISIINFSWLTS